MKFKLLLMGALCLLGFAVAAQTKGTSALGLGFGFNNSKFKNGQNGVSTESEIKQTSYSIGYGLFVKDNHKISFDVSFGKWENNVGQNSNKNEIFGTRLSYHKYIPIVNKLFIQAGGTAGFESTKQNLSYESKIQTYNIGANGGVSWFFSKRFALETTLLSANILYSTKNNEETPPGVSDEYESKSFSLSTQGNLTNLGFKIFFLF